MVGWHHQFNGHEFEQTSGNGEGQGSLMCYSTRGHRVRQDLATEQHQHWRWGKLLKNAVPGPHPTLNYTGPRGEAESLHFQSAFWMLLTHYRAWCGGLENALNAVY